MPERQPTQYTTAQTNEVLEHLDAILKIAGVQPISTLIHELSAMLPRSADDALVAQVRSTVAEQLISSTAALRDGLAKASTDHELIGKLREQFKVG